MKYKNLKIGDVRQAGDEYRSNLTPPALAGGYVVKNGKALKKPKAGTAFDTKAKPAGKPSPPVWSAWVPVSLLGHPILASDLCSAAFRRPSSE